MSQRHAYVYFATGKVAITKSNWFQWVKCAVVRTITRCEFVHVMVAYDGAVLDRGSRGTRYWPEIELHANHPSLACRFQVPIEHPIELDGLYTPRPVRLLPCLLRWITGGRFQADDCIQTTITALAQGGVSVPRISSPKSLWDWLRGEGHALTLCGLHTRPSLGIDGHD